MSFFVLATVFFPAIIGVSPASAVTCSTATFTGIYGLFYNGYDGTSPAVSVGQITADGKGGVTGSFTHSVAGKIQEFSFTGQYVMAKNCIGTVSYVVDGVAIDLSITLNGSNKGYQILRTDSGTVNVGFIQQLETATCGLSGKAASFALHVFNGAGSTTADGYSGLITLDGKAMSPEPCR